MNLHYNYVSASEAGDYFQVLFAEKPDSDDNYFLIQRGFEFDNNTCYIESPNYDIVGHFKIIESSLTRTNFYIEIKNKNSFSIFFKTSEDNFKEVKKILKIILSGFNCFQIKC